MNLAGFEFRPTVVPTIVFVVVLALLLSLGSWQLGRAHEKQALQSARTEQARAETLRFGRDRISPEDRFRVVTMTGRYREAPQWLLDNRISNGEVGYHVYTLFEPVGDADPRLLVNRGWVSVGPTRDLLPKLDVPAEDVTLTGRLDRPASVGLRLAQADYSGLAPVTVVQYLDVAELAAAQRLDLGDGGALALVLDPGQPGSYRYDWQQLSAMMTPEKHLGYAVQWFGLALALVIIYIGTNTRRRKHPQNDEHATY